MWLLGPEVTLDLAELAGRRFTCLDGCGLCCLCQPELLESEVHFFKSNFPQRIVARKSPHRHTALTLKQGSGPCSFLEDRRCTIYQSRPHYCRQFPFHIYLGSRVQVELDLSCRGVWLDQGEDTTSIALRMLDENQGTVRKTLRESKEVYRQFGMNCRDAGLDCSADRLRREVSARVERMADPAYLGWMLDQSVEDEEMTFDQEPVGAVLDELRREELRQAAMETSLESLASEDPTSAPVYCDPQNRWNIFISSGGELDMYILKDEGGMERVRTINSKQVPLLAPEGRGRKLFIDYLATLNRRDSVLGYAYYLMDDYGYEDEMPNVYYGVLSAAALDLLWRASLLAHLKGGRLDEEGVREGIIFYDMDRLDAPTIGAFI
jgi:Fe-S-cluster containining protein